MDFLNFSSFETVDWWFEMVGGLHKLCMRDYIIQSKIKMSKAIFVKIYNTYEFSVKVISSIK
jgi:hypothetical protein